MGFMLYSIGFTLLVFCDTEAAISCGECLQPPDFISNYTILKSQSQLSEVTIHHGLGEIPIKVDVQVRPTRGADRNFVFPGIGSAQRDDDVSGIYGGVVYKYDDTSVRLYVPNMNDGSKDGTVIYTGNSNTWFGPTSQKEDRVEVRVRAWRACKFPTPDHESPWISMKVKNGTDSFREIRHGLGVVPGYVTVQVRNNHTNWFTDGIGPGMTISNIKAESSWGGVVYAFNDTYVRLWVPGFDTGMMFSVADGWGNGSKEIWSEGLVKVRVWSSIHGNTIYNTTGQIGSPGLTSQILVAGGNSLNMDTGIIAVTVKATDGNNNGFSFPAMGAVQNDDPGTRIGGVVYSYSSQEVRVWHPILQRAGNAAMYTRGYVIYLSSYWGGGINSQTSKTGQLEVRLWNPFTGVCPPRPTKGSNMRTTSPSYRTTDPGLRPGLNSTLVNGHFTTTSQGFRTTTRTGHVTASQTRLTSKLSSSTPGRNHITSRKPSQGIVTHSNASPVGGKTTSVKPSRGTSTGRIPTSGSGHVSRQSTIRNGLGSGSITTRPGNTGKTSATPGVGQSRAPSQGTGVTPTAGSRINTKDETGQDSGGLSPVATGLIAAGSVLAGLGCLSGLLFGLLRKWKKEKEKRKVVDEKPDVFGSQSLNGQPPTDTTRPLTSRPQ